ncbi:ABC transporter ATP-binding protein [Qiania dongpingensis]|uniref:ABC transporter ATP-binding protein n=1 Tax=Qiania dongpingensis TaxID=2763669 RepID=A0A7G9G1Z1_9FIRM|nr:ABC transporter ATP-binding protein [Qiania dongpingensis]QNM04823.1 ABC transporter ATP-binding protein [Qiania dongpingensis]
MEALLKISNVEKYYGSKAFMTKALDNISFQVEKGEFLGIMGASGSGKTTLLNCISTIDSVTAGHIHLRDTDITELRDKELARFRMENLGFVFQDFNLLDTLTIEENIALAPLVSGKEENIGSHVKEIAERLGIGDILKKFPYEVSGGQKQRCACARALIGKPALVLADEPTGALDSKAAGMLLESFTDMNQNMDATILMVTHDLFSASYCSRILFLQDGKIFNEIWRGGRTRKEFFGEIMDVVTFLGGEADAR